MLEMMGVWVILVVLGFIILGGLMWWMSKRILQCPLSDRGADRLFHGLLVTITIIIFAIFLEDSHWYGQLMYLFGMPLLVTLVAITCLHIYRTRSLHSRRTVVTLLIHHALIVPISIWYVQNTPSYARYTGLIIVLALVGSGLTSAVIWQTVQGHSRQLWLVLGIVIVATGIYEFAYNGLLNTWPIWVLCLLEIVATFLIPVLLVALAGRVAVYLADVPHMSNWRRWLAGAFAAGVLVVLLIIHLVEMFLLDGVADWGVVGMPVFLGILAIAVALLLIWTLDRRRIAVALAYLVVMAAAIVVFFVFVFSLNDNPEEITVARAEQVNDAIHAYFADNDYYPVDLYDLIPRHLLTIPNPVQFYDHIWCYEGGDAFYRLAYVFRPGEGAPGSSFTILEHDSAGKPPAESWACDTLLIEYRDRWGGDI